MARQVKPQKLRSGARIGIVSPSYWLEPERLERALGVFRELGYEPVPGTSTGLRDNQCAGTPAQRAADIMAMFSDPSIEAIVCARGGYGGNRVLPLLDYDVIRRNPKIFVGYSDVTGLLNSIAHKTGLVTFHGPMLSSFGKQTIQYNLDVFHEVLSGRPDVRVMSPPECRARCLRAGSARGPLWGGNFTLVIERLGTADQIYTEGSILLLEDIDEKLYRFDRMMLHLKRSGSLDGIRGLVIGELLEIADSKVPFGKTTDEIVLDVCGDLDIPIISNFPCGHGDYQATLPVAYDVKIHADEMDPHILIPGSPVA